MSLVYADKLTLKNDRPVLTTFFLILMWLPIPLGSVTSWGWSGVTFTIWGAFVFYYHLQPVRSLAVLKRHKIPLGLFASIILWHLVQLFPMPAFIISFLQGNGIVRGENPDFWQVLSINPEATLLSCVQAASLLGLFALTLLLIRSMRRICLLLLAITGAGLFQALYGGIITVSGMQYSPVFDLPTSPGASGTFLSPEQFAYFLLISVSASLGLLLISLKKKDVNSVRARLRRVVAFFFGRSTALRLAVLILFTGMLLAQTSTTLLACACVVTILAISGLKWCAPRTSRYAWFVSSLLILDLMLIYGWAAWYSAADSAAHDQPLSQVEWIFSLTGAGAGTAADSRIQAFALEAVNQLPYHGSDLSQLLAEFGVIGSLPFVAIVLWCLWWNSKIYITARHGVVRGSAFCCLAVILCSCIVVVTSAPLQSPANAAYFTVVLALALICTEVKPARNGIKNQAYKGAVPSASALVTANSR